MPLPKIHPMKKTFVDLRRCVARMDEFTANFDSNDMNEVDLYMELREEIKTLMEKIPQEFRE
jgi:hypothetical protein